VARVVVKVCGITRAEDARVACDAGADWLGFILSGDSPRLIAPERAAEIAAEVPRAVTVGVMVGPTPDEALRLARAAGVTRVQLHRVDLARWPADFPLAACVAVPVAPDGALTEALPDPRHLVLLDAAHDTLAGGTGTLFPWETARIVAATRPVLLAGGLDAANVGHAIGQVRPFGVDASSRLESAPGIKDEDKVRAYVAAARAADRDAA
jgi:phosphoribosylanthranilate isomerase